MNQHSQSGDFIVPDLGIAATFLRALDPQAECFTFQTVDDDKVRKSNELSRIIPAPLSAAAPQLMDLNRRGAGIFVAVNQTNGGRKLSDVVQDRAIWQDDDTGAGAPADGFPAPHIVVESSPGKFQRLWLTEDLGPESHRVLMRMMVDQFGCDKNAVGRNRVLRLPGFWHMKGTPHMSRLLHATVDARPFRFADFSRWTGPLITPPEKYAASPSVEADRRKIMAALGCIAAEDRDTWLKAGMAVHHAFEGDEEGFELWSYWSRSSPKFDGQDQRRVWESFSGTGTTLGTLFHMARERGWRDVEPLNAFASLEPLKTDNRDGIATRFVPLGLPLKDLKSIPARSWMVRGLLLRGAVSMLVAPGGTGKSAFTLNVATARALGDGRRFGLDVCEAGKALIINAEDDIHELQRRMGALTMHYGFDPKALEGRLKAYDSFGARSERFKAVVREGGRLRRTPHVAELIRIARGEGFDFLSVDPLVKTHEANENDNGEMDFVVATYSEIAQEINGSVLLVHHTRKPPNADAEGFAGNADAGRGASSAKDACRIARTLFTMTASEAKRLRVSEDERLSYVRLDDAKGNYSAQKSGGQWFKKHSVSLPNGDDAPALAPVVFAHSEIENARRGKILASLASAENSGKGMAATTRGRDNAASYISKDQKLERDLIISDLKILESVGDIKKYDDAGTERWAVTKAGRAWASLPEHSAEHSHSEHSVSTLDELNNVEISMG